MTHVTVSQRKGGLSRRSPAGRSFAFEFSRIRGIAPVLENEITDRLNGDESFCVMQQSGMAAVAEELRVGCRVTPEGETPVGILGYKVRMPDGELVPLAREVQIYLGADGSPIFQVGRCKFNNLDTAAMLMSVAIRNLRTKNKK